MTHFHGNKTRITGTYCILNSEKRCLSLIDGFTTLYQFVSVACSIVWRLYGTGQLVLAATPLRYCLCQDARIGPVLKFYRNLCYNPRKPVRRVRKIGEGRLLSVVICGSGCTPVCPRGTNGRIFMKFDICDIFSRKYVEKIEVASYLTNSKFCT